VPVASGRKSNFQLENITSTWMLLQKYFVSAAFKQFTKVKKE
jgi:hypothetical protein